MATREQKERWLKENQAQGCQTIMEFVKKTFSEKGSEGVKEITKPEWVSPAYWEGFIKRILDKEKAE